MWIESINTNNPIVNLDNVISINKSGDSGILFKHWENGFVWWSYSDKEKRDKEHSYVKLYIKPTKMGVHNG